MSNWAPSEDYVVAMARAQASWLKAKRRTVRGAVDAPDEDAGTPIPGGTSFEGASDASADAAPAAPPTARKETNDGP